MKILMLCWRDTHHPQGGGSERYLERVAQYLSHQGHEVIVRTARYPGARRRERSQGVDFHRGGGRLTVYIHAAFLLSLARIRRGPYRDVDVIVDTQNGIPFFARVFAGRPTVLLTHHCHREQWPVAGPFLARLGWFLESRVAPWVYRHSQYVTVSQPSATELSALGVAPERITIIRNGIDPAPHLADTPKELRLVTLSRLVPHKQLEHAMDVVAALAPEHDIYLDIIGSGWWEEHLRTYAHELGVQGRVIFHGQVTEQRKHQLLARALIHLMPSRKEGWGLAVVEAAQHCVPTVGYRSSSGLRDSVVDQVTGLLVDTKAQLIDATSQLIRNPECCQLLGDAARRRAAGFSWESTGAEFAALLEEQARRAE
ncbi:glycosyltransferase family 4 protein [Corynebacterium epidermidicanis]|uniref:Glycosyltransferase n=1 Tax=Corynebacterium epidermidicanis TaxID=1050174 RepID=A0A0G3GX98_9CORY|nr:glycosyltransferase family 4 protein [Corynebacterium epidermidicanis]AKK04128.1 glycosyltransferase [Corynebacterium epidermidicanis]